jgi:hypothetical protein
MNKFNVNVAWGIGVTTVTNVHSIIDDNRRNVRNQLWDIDDDRKKT